MRLLSLVSLLVLVLLVSCATTQETLDAPTTDPTTLERVDNPQIGVNFVRFYWDDTLGPDAVDTLSLEYEVTYPETIFADFDQLNAHAFRQFVKADLLWDVVESEDDAWHFTAQDEVLTNLNYEPVVTLYAMQYASPNAPWSDDFSHEMTPEAVDYITTVVTRYAPYVTYWEIGNEMDHWTACDSQEAQAKAQENRLDCSQGGFSAEEQAAFYQATAALIRSIDPDAQIVLPGMGSIGSYTLQKWFIPVLEAGGTDWFDVVNYHYYGTWQEYAVSRDAFQNILDTYDLSDKPVWLTETGASASESLDLRTDYPNSYETQAADVFRRLIQAYAAGDDLVMWHSYIGSPNTPDNMWRLYGLRSDVGTDAIMHPSYYAFQLLSTELIPFATVEQIDTYVYEITTEDGQVKYVAWGDGEFVVPEGITQYTSVVSDIQGDFSWQDVGEGESVALSDIPLLFR